MFQPLVEKYLQQYNYPKIDLKAVLFDMDGVLFDSMKNHTAAWHDTIAELGIECQREEFYMYEGRTGRSTINIFFNRCFGRDASEEEIERIYTRKSEIFNTLPKAEPMEGAHSLLNKVKALGLTPVLVTGSGQGSLLDKLEHQFPHIFTPELMVTAFDVKQGKPHPEPYLMGLDKAGIQPHQAVVVENAPLGVEAGVAAGIFTIGVNTGPLPDSVLLESGANLLLPSVQQLNETFEQLYHTLK